MSDKKDIKVIPKVKGYVSKNKYVESVFVDSKPAFLVKDIESEKISVEYEIKISEKTTLRPLYSHECGYIPFSFTSNEIEKLNSICISKERLFGEIMNEVKRYVVVEPRDHLLICGEILLTYCQEWIDTIHFPFFVGETESGKSSVLHIGKWLNYRCLISEDLPHADIYNFLGTEEEGTGTICEDEAQEMAKDREKIRTYKNSYSRGSSKPRVIMTNKGKYQVFYKTFCCKWFAGESVPQDKGFLERLVIVYMIGGQPDGNIKRATEKEKESLQELRKKLLFWKMQNIGKEFPRIYSWLEGRDQELWEDYLSIFSGTKYEELAKETAQYYLKQRHQTIKESLESVLFRILKPFLDKEKEIKSKQIWDIITTSDILPGKVDDRTNRTFYPDEMDVTITPNSLAKILQYKYQAKKIVRTKSLNGRNKRTTYYVFNEKVLDILSKKYKIDSDF